MEDERIVSLLVRKFASAELTFSNLRSNYRGLTALSESGADPRWLLLTSQAGGPGRQVKKHSRPAGRAGSHNIVLIHLTRLIIIAMLAAGTAKLKSAGGRSAARPRSGEPEKFPEAWRTDCLPKPFGIQKSLIIFTIESSHE